MPHLFQHGERSAPRDPSNTQAYLVGGGIAALAAAVHLIQDAKVPGSQIHILESMPQPGGSLDGAGSPSDGYVLRGGRMFNFSYLCTYEMLDKIPSLTDPERSVMQEIRDFNAKQGNKTHARARLVEMVDGKPRIVDVKKMGLSNQDRLDLLKLAVEPEKNLGASRIQDHFPKEFFQTNFWYMWATM